MSLNQKFFILFSDIILVGGRKEGTALFSSSSTRQEWTELRKLPSSRTNHGSVVIKNTLYTIGGVGYENIDKYDAATKSFVTVRSIDTYIFEFGSCNYNEDSIMVAGGYFNYRKTNRSFVFNTSSNVIWKLGDLNESKYGLVLVNCLGTVYAIGGYGDGVCKKLIERYNPKENKWEKLTTSLIIGRYHHGAVSHNELIYIFGGRNEHGKAEDSVERFNTNTSEIELISSRLSVPRLLFGICTLGNDVYICGGLTVLKNTETVEVFNLNTEQFRFGKNLPFADYGFTANVLEE